MARYGGGHEDLDKALAATNELIADIDRLAAAEASYQGEVTKGTAAETDAARAARSRARAKQEAAEVDSRAARAAKTSAEAVKVDTAAIKANTEARQRANRVTSMQGRAVAGARSPQYAEAYRLSQEQGAIPSQYRLRQIQGVGQRRAAAMVEAMKAGLVPSAGGVDINRPLSRVAAAHEAVAAQEYRLAQASEEYTRIKRKGTESEALAQYAQRERVKAELQSSRSELTNAEQAQVTAMERNRAAIHADTEARQRVVAEAHRTAREGLAGRPGVLGLPAPGQTVQGMPVGLAQTRTRVEIPAYMHTEAAARSAKEAAEASEAMIRRLALPAPGQTVQGMPVHLAQTRTAVPLNTPDFTLGRSGARQSDLNDLARRAEAEGRLADAAKIYNDHLNNPARAKALQMSALATQYADQQAAATRRAAEAYTQSASGFYPLSQAMHRHGALTSEFIVAAARGETTLRELGNQAVITAGKFAGWTVAAAGVYGVLGALQQVGKGAMDASAGADQAFRVISSGQDKDAIQGSFADLSRQFNVPIETAADAVYRMGQVFHNQADAVEAAKASLLSYKTGEVGVEESTRSLIAIQSAFGLSANELVGIFDQINAAQNKFGVGIGDVEAGLAKAGGAWKQSGGDLSYLLALMTAIQKATGRTGQEIGTSMSRLYYVQHPESAQKLKDLGVDVDTQDVQKTFESMLAQAQKPGADIIGLATGFAGGQYQRLITPVLADQKRFREAQRETNSEAAKGSGWRELAKVLGQVDEQIAQIGNSMQRIGEELNRAGAFTFLGLMLKAVNGTLRGAEALLGVFNMLPGPLRQALMLVGQMALGIALLRRLGATERLVNSPFGALADPAGRQKTHTIVGLRQGQQEAFNRAERYGQHEVDASHRLSLAQRQAEDSAARLRSVQHLDPEDEGRKKVEREYIRNAELATKRERELEVASRNLQTAREVAAHSEDQLTLAQNTSKRQFGDLARQQRWPAVRELDQPNTAGLAAPGMLVGTGGPGGLVRGSAATRAAATAGAASAVAAERAIAANMSFVGRKTAETVAAMRVAPQQMSSALAAWGASGAFIARGAGRGGAVAARAAVSLRGAATTLRALALSVGAALGPLDIILLGIIGFVTAAGKIGNASKKADQVRGTLESAPSTSLEIKKQQDEAYRVVNQQLNDTLNKERPGTQIGPLNTGEFLGPIKDAGRTLRGIWNDWNGVTDTAVATIRAEEERTAAIAKQEKAGKPRPQMAFDELAKDVENDAKARQAGLISQREFDRRMANHAVEAKVMYNTNRDQIARMNQLIADANRAAGGVAYGESLVPLDAQAFQQQMQGTAAAIQLYGLTEHNMSYLKAQYQAAEQKWRNSNKPEDLQALNQARQAYYSAIQEEVQKELQVDLLQATNENQRRAAFRKANDTYQKMRVKFKEQNSRTRDRQKQEREDLKKQQEREDQGGIRHQRQTGEEGAADPSAGTYDPSDAEVQKREDRQRRDRIKLSRAQKKAMNKELARQNRELTIAQLELKQSAYDDRQQGRDILLNLQISQTRDPARQAALRVRMAKRQVEDAEREWGDNSRQYRQALTDLNNARMQQADAVLASVQADNALLLAQAGSDPVNRARVEAENAQRELDSLRTQGADPNAIKEGRARVIDARRAAKDAADSQMQEMARLRGELAAARAGDDPVAAAQAAVDAAKLARSVADTPLENLQALVDLAKANNALREAIAEKEHTRYELLKSMTDDPVERARLDMEEARNALKGAKGYDKTKKQADYNNAKRAWQEAQIDSRADDINWRLQMDQITNEEAAKQLEELAKVKGISEQKKRDLLLQAKQLRDQASGDYELDVGDVRLPTLYEVKRYVNGGKEVASATDQGAITDNRTFTVYLQTAEAVNAFAQQLELTNGTSAKATALSMMMR